MAGEQDDVLCPGPSSCSVQSRGGQGFQEKYDTEYSSLLLRFVVESEPKVQKLQGIVKQLEDTAKVRGVHGYVDDTPKKMPKKSRPAISPTEASEPEDRSAKRVRTSLG